MITISLQFQTKYYCSSLINHWYVGSSAPRNHSQYLLGRVLARYSVLSFFLFFFFFFLPLFSVPLATPREFTCTSYYGTAQRTLTILWYNQWMTDCVPWRGWAGDRDDLSRALSLLLPRSYIHFFVLCFFTRKTSVVYLGVIKIQMEIEIDIYCIRRTVVQISR